MQCLECDSHDIRDDCFCESCGRPLHASPSFPDEGPGDVNAAPCRDCGATPLWRSCRACGEATAADRELCEVCGSTLMDVLQALHPASRSPAPRSEPHGAEPLASAPQTCWPPSPVVDDQPSTAMGDLLASLDAAAPLPALTPEAPGHAAPEQTLPADPPLDTETPELAWALDVALMLEASEAMPAQSHGEESNVQPERPLIDARPAAASEPSCQAPEAGPETVRLEGAHHVNLTDPQETAVTVDQPTQTPSATCSVAVPMEEHAFQRRTPRPTMPSAPRPTTTSAARVARPHASHGAWKGRLTLGAAAVVAIVSMGGFAVQRYVAGNPAGAPPAEVGAIPGSTTSEHGVAGDQSATASPPTADPHNLPAYQPPAPQVAIERLRPGQPADGGAAVAAPRSTARRRIASRATPRRQATDDRAAGNAIVSAPTQIPARLVTQPALLTMAPPVPPVVEASAGPAFEVTDVDVRPRIEHRVEPRYPEHARERGIEEVIVVRVLVSPAGRPTDMLLLRRSPRDPAFDAAALAAVRQWRFAPARKRERAVSCWFNVGVPFRAASGS